MSDLFNLYAEAGSPNGDDQPQSAIRWAADEIERLRVRCEEADSRICRQHEYLKSLVSICTKQAKLLDSSVDPLVDLTERFLRSGEIDSGEHRSYVLRKQAEAVEALGSEMGSTASRCGRLLILWAKDYAQRLRQQAAESEEVKNETEQRSVE